MSHTTLQLQEVFVLSGVPQHTFVQPVEYTRLLVTLRTPGRSVLVEGPSGIGKTTAVTKAITDAGITGHVVSLSARKKEDVSFIKELPNQLPIGTVLIDDFHRLDDSIKKDIADLMKTLADESATHSKLIVLGIRNAGQSLILFGKDLANRIEIIAFEANPEHKIEQFIKGEAALNIAINIRDEIISAAQGSFYIAQMLAYHTCIRGNIFGTANPDVTTSESYESIKTYVMAALAPSFHDTAVAFARGTKLRREGRAPYLHLLHWISQSPTWSINANRSNTYRHPEQRGSVSQVVNKGYLKQLIDASPDIQRVLHFDPVNSTLIAQDPQFVFYIRNLSWAQFAEEVGFFSLDFPSRYDFALSFAGSDCDIAEALFYNLQERELEVFYDKNEQHRILVAYVEEYLGPIYSSDAQLVISILGPDYPKRIWTKFESEQFKQRFKSGEVIPIVLNTAPLGVFDSATKVGHILFDKTGDMVTQILSATESLIGKALKSDRAKNEIQNKRLQPKRRCRVTEQRTLG